MILIEIYSQAKQSCHFYTWKKYHIWTSIEELLKKWVNQSQNVSKKWKSDKINNSQPMQWTPNKSFQHQALKLYKNTVYLIFSQFHFWFENNITAKSVNWNKFGKARLPITALIYKASGISYGCHAHNPGVAIMFVIGLLLYVYSIQKKYV